VAHQFKPQHTSETRSNLPDFQLACPYLGFQGDRQTRARVPSVAHRCFSDVAKPKPVTEAHQQSFCIGTNYDECAIFKASAKVIPMPLVTPVTVPLPSSAGPPPAIILMAILVLLGAMALAILVIARTWSNSDSVRDPAPAAARTPDDATVNAQATVAGASPTAPLASTTVAVVAPSETAVLATATVAAATPTSAPATATPTTPPTAVPTPVAAPRRYTVLNGDSYIGIAAKLGVTLDELLRVNGRTQQTPLYPNDVLIIP
jgi:LysM repeat protein